MKKLFTKQLAVISILLLSTWSVNSEIYYSFTGTVTLGYTEVSTEQAKAIADRWITTVSFPGTNTSGRCSSVASSFNMTNSRSIEFWVDKCDSITVNANIATSRGLTVAVDGTVVYTINGNGACTDWGYKVNKEVPCKIKVTGLNASSAYVSLFKFHYAPKIPTIIGFVAEGITTAIDQNSTPKTITANLPYGTSLTAITPTVTIGGIATSYSPTGSQDFSNSVATPVVYTATDDVLTTNYNVTLTANKNTDKSLNNLKIGGVSPAYDANAKTYSLILPKGTTLNQTVTFDLTFRATANFTSGNTNDFTNPLVITVTAEDESKQAYTVNVAAASKNIAYIINTAISTTDTKIRPELAKTYYLDNILIANITTSTDFSMYDLVILTESPSSGSGGMKALWGINKPLLGLKMFSVNSNTWNQATATNPPSPAVLSINVNEPNHPIFSGITLTGTNLNELNILSAAPTGNGLQQSTYATDYSIAYVKGAVLTNIIEFPLGKTSDVTGTTNAALQNKLMIVGIANDNQNNVTDDGLKLIKNACAYLMGSTSWGTNAGTMFKDISVNGVGSPTIGQSTATIQWNAVPCATKYVITGTGGPFSIKGLEKAKSAINIDVAGNLTSYYLTGLIGGTEYSFTVKAQNAAGVNSLPASINITTLTTGISTATIQGVTFDGKTIRNTDNKALTVFDATGRLVISSTKDINMSAQAKGIYIVKGENGMLKIALTK